jgi:hypothetical protein
MKITDKRISEIIREEVNALDFFKALNQQSGELTPWDAETKMERMKPTNAMKSKGGIPTRDYGVIRGYNDWSENFRDRMTYPEYCVKFGLRRK